MNITKKVLGFSLVFVAAALLLTPHASMAQDSATKRKVSHRVVPDYPGIAREMNITGKVKIEATVEPDGHVKSTRAVGGSPLLLESAEKALKSWKFEPGPKETVEVVEFDFNGQ
ncbi:MAG TPA: energy transducer TonB [Candidatus Acidoferrales bacterium]|nr:energy transducer TonB [Candidatus Acidoferrales bacterium]